MNPRLAALFLCLLLCFASASAQILQSPSSQLVAENARTLFFCTAMGDLYWEVDGDIVTSFDEDSLNERGIFIDYVYSGGTVNSSVDVHASVENNQTTLTCIAVSGRQSTQASATLTVAGPPSKPQPSARILSATAVEITWNKPFSWEEFSIHNYTLRIENSSSSEVILTQHLSASGNVLEHIFTNEGEIPTQCHTLFFNVCAANSIGHSQTGYTTGGFPIAPSSFHHEPHYEVTFQSDLTPMIDITFTFPEVCVFQSATYSISVHHPQEGIIITSGPHPYLMINGPNVTMEIQTGLRPNEDYEATITVETVVDSTAIAFTFNTSHSIPTTSPGNSTTPTTIPTTTSTQDSSVATTTTTEAPSPVSSSVLPSKDGDTTLIIGASVGAIAVVLLLITAILLAATCVIVKRQRSFKRAARQTTNVASACASMVPNPIYTTGPIYEEIGDGMARKPIQTQSSYRSHDSGYIEIPLAYEKAIDSKASLSSPDSGTSDSCRKFDLTPHNGTIVAITDETYTVMRPVGPVSAQLGGGGLTASTCVDVEALAEFHQEQCAAMLTTQGDDGRYITTV